MTHLFIIILAVVYVGHMAAGLLHTAEELLEESKRCVRAKVESGKKYKRTTDGDSFDLNFGDPLIEVFHALSIMDMRTIDYLEQCVKNLEPDLFLDRTGLWNRNLTHGGANVTYLTGIFQQVLPDVHQKILDNAEAAMMRSSAIDKKRISSSVTAAGVKRPPLWDVNFKYLGIRSVQYTSFEYRQSRMSEEEKKLRRDKARADVASGKKEKLTIGGYTIADEDELMENGEEEYDIIPYRYDPEADEHLSDYLRDDKKGRYTLHINLSDRAHFHGGEVMIRKKKVVGSAEAVSEDDDEHDPNFHVKEEMLESEEYDDEEALDLGDIIGIERVNIPRKHEGGRKKPKHAPGPRFHARHTEIGRYTPERGSILVMRDDYQHGMQPIINGRRHGLVIEFWGYADSLVGEKRPIRGVPLATGWNEL
jgi:hypothetical protein